MATKCLSMARRRLGHSGSPSPTLNRNIGFCYCRQQAQPGKTLQIMIRNQPVDAVTVAIRFTNER